MIVGVVIETDRGYLCQLRDDKPGIKFPGLWGFFGGHSDHGESPDAALRRELIEELEYEPEKLEPFFHIGDFVLFRCFATEVDIRAMRLHEGVEMRSISIDDLGRYEFIPACRTLLLTLAHVKNGQL